MLLVCPTVFLSCCYCVLNVSLVCPCRVVSVSSACPCHVNCVSLACPWRVPDVLLACTPESQRLPVFGGLLQDNDTQRLGLNFQKFLKINQLLYIAARSHTHSHSHTHTDTLTHTLSLSHCSTVCQGSCVPCQLDLGDLQPSAGQWRASTSCLSLPASCRPSLV